MIAMSLDEIAAVTGGVVHPAGTDPAARTVTAPAFVDSRMAEPGGLFVAIAGERVDGHDYAAAAVGAGAAAVLGTRETGTAGVVVTDAVVALGRLARHVTDTLVAERGLTVLAMTGSVGKTGTKDYLAHLLATAGPTIATAGNLNNEIGVPLTVLRATRETRFLVVEMGARGIGHIAELCAIVPPRVAAVLNVGSAHLGEFGSREAIAQAKGEILEALPADGTAVVTGDDPALEEALRRRTPARVLTFGRAGTADLTLADEGYDDLGRPGIALTWRADGLVERVRLAQVGRHQALNAGAAVLMATAAGLDRREAARALEGAASASRWRMETTALPDRTVVINDAYNANPESMRAALDTLAALGRRRAARTVAVLGEMRELGATAEAEHRDLGRHAARLGVDLLVVVGDAGKWIADGARSDDAWSGEVILTSGSADASARVRENVSPGDVVLVKASRGVALEQVAAMLVDTADETTAPRAEGGAESR